MEQLPAILGKTVKSFTEEMGVHRDTFMRWCKGAIPCSSLVVLCNRYRISLSSFLILKESVDVGSRAADYVYPEETWKEVKWDSAPIGRIFGPGGMTGVSGIEAARRLGFSSKQIFDRWRDCPDILRLDDFIRMLNEFKIDATMFLEDDNVPVPLPVWEEDNKHIAEIVADRMKGYRKLQSIVAEKDKEIHALRLDKERLERELALLKARKGSGEGARPVELKAAALFQERGYAFHLDLWERMHEFCGMTRRDFCEAVGVSYHSSYNWKNIPVKTLIKACNMTRMSVSHFFLPKGEVPVVHDGGYYVVSPRLFSPIEDRMDNMKYLFGRYSAAGFSMEDLERQGVGRRGLDGMSKQGGTARVLTLCDICTTFNIPPNVFFKDDNRKKAPYFQSINERLLLNAIGAMKELEELRAEIRKAKKK